MTQQSHYWAHTKKKPKGLMCLNVHCSTIYNSQEDICGQAGSILCNPTDCSLLGSSVHGILQARILEWVAMFSSRESSQQQGSNPCLLPYRQILYH